MNENKSGLNQIYNVIFDITKKWQLILLVCVTCALGFDTYQSLTYIPMYRCEATFAVNTSLSSSSSNGRDDIGETFTYIFSSNIFKRQIQNVLNVPSLNGDYSSMMRKGTNVLYVYATSPSAKMAYEMMDALINNYQDISGLVVGNTNIDLLKDITAPIAPYNQLNHKRNILGVGAVSGIAVIVLIIFLSLMKNTIKDKYDIENKLNLHLLGSLPRESKIISLRRMKRKKSILISQYSTSFQYSEAFKRIRSRVERYSKKHDLKVIMVTSSLENEGKSSVTVNLALSLAMNKHKVLLIDGDLRKPALHLILDYQDEITGIDDVLNNKTSLKKAIVTLDNYHLDVLFGKGSIEDINEKLNSKKMKEIINEVRKEYDYVIIDSAPSCFLSDSNMLATLVDGILLVVKQNYASVSAILGTIERLSLSSASIIGGVNNQSFSGGISSGKYYGYRYGYGHYYGYRRREQKNGE